MVSRGDLERLLEIASETIAGRDKHHAELSALCHWAQRVVCKTMNLRRNSRP
eukprot:COSAG02_NODE_3003_length_7572_cov_5.390740_1_plen_52_part_00